MRDLDFYRNEKLLYEISKDHLEPSKRVVKILDSKYEKANEHCQHLNALERIDLLSTYSV